MAAAIAAAGLISPLASLEAQGTPLQASFAGRSYILVRAEGG
jgi:hypothetical protein